MNAQRIINAARAGILAAGLEMSSVTNGPLTTVGVRSKTRYQFFTGRPLACWTQAYEYATGNPWPQLLKQWRQS